MRKIKLYISFIFFLSIINLFAQSDTTANPEADKVISVVQNVDDGGNFLDQLSFDSTLSLPFGIIRQIGSARYIVAIDSSKFLPQGAYFNAYAAIDFPGTTKKIAFAAKNIKFNPVGVVGGNQARLMLVSEHIIKINNTVSLKIVKDGNNFVEWDCNGFKAISLKGEFLFSKTKLLPDSSQTTDKVVRATFQIYTNDIHDFVTQVSITPFFVEGLKGWSFNVTNATVDMSELVNAPTMVFPAGYTNPNMLTPAMWSGFYLESLKVKLPSEISQAGKRSELEVHNLLIDNMGLTGLFQVNNVFSTEQGTMSGWGFSLDELGVGFLCNQLNSGHLKGKVSVPIMDSTQTLVYNANVYYNPQSKETDYSFALSPANNLKFNVFSAQVTLNSNSQLLIVKSNGLLKPTAVLNGLISFNHAKFDSKGDQLAFQNLTILTQAPYVTNGLFTLHLAGGQNPKAANFPVSINDITFGVNNGFPLLSFSVTVNFMNSSNSGFSAGTLVGLQAKIVPYQQSYTGEAPATVTKTKWEFDKFFINGVSLNTVTSVFTLNGTVIFRDNDPVYGDGFFGQISFSIPNVLPSPVQISACLGAKATYRYFYIDAAVPVNIPLGTVPITLTKLMGGLYYHMNPQNTSQAQMIAASQNQSSTTTNALTYIPDSTISIGFKAGVGFKYSSSEVVANGDVLFEINFTSSGGLGIVKLAGDVYVLVNVNERVKAPVKGSILVQYDGVNSVFDANATVTINAYNAITGNGFIKMHIEPGVWYVCVGKPTTTNQINIMNMVTAESYFMVGNSIEPANAPPPEVATILGASGLNGNRDDTKLSNGAGFCAGARLNASLYKQYGFSFFQVYGSYAFGLGFDMMLMNYGSNSYCDNDASQKVGLNGWQASGNMYLYMQGNVGVKGNIRFLPGCNCDNENICFCRNFDFTVFDLGVAAIVGGKLPKPIYFYGQIGCYYNIFGKVSGTFNFHFDYGSNCNPVTN
ncbi:MAG: hypothetical protein J0M08_08645 [Bacteroidetes bacterium]|nr:hypothetical protein [Bacteroidota bacterium]